MIKNKSIEKDEEIHNYNNIELETFDNGSNYCLAENYIIYLMFLVILILISYPIVCFIFTSIG